jgi:hypothetical protein
LQFDFYAHQAYTCAVEKWRSPLSMDLLNAWSARMQLGRETLGLQRRCQLLFASLLKICSEIENNVE